MAKFLVAVLATAFLCAVLAWNVPWVMQTIFTWKGVGFAPLFFVAVVGTAGIYGMIKK